MSLGLVLVCTVVAALAAYIIGFHIGASVQNQAWMVWLGQRVVNVKKTSVEDLYPTDKTDE